MLDLKVRHPSYSYKILEKIGSGSYGNVFKAETLTNKKVRALKSMFVKTGSDFVMIKQEVRTMNICRHENVVEFYEVFLCKKELWIAMEFCDGGPLNDIVQALGPLHEDEIVYVIKNVTNGISFIHSQKLIHRDIKGANILMTSEGLVKIADFGVSAQLVGTLNKRKTIIGSPYWMAPEVINARSTEGYNHLCDIWSIGILAIELAETLPPLYKIHPMDVLHIIAKSNYVSPVLANKDQWSADFHSFIKRLLTKNVRKRPTAEECLALNFLSRPELTEKVGVYLVNRYLHPGREILRKYDDVFDSLTLKNEDPKTFQEKAQMEEPLVAEPSEDETDEYFDHFTHYNGKTIVKVTIDDFQKSPQSSPLATDQKFEDLLLVCSNLRIPPIYGADYWFDPNTNTHKLFLAAENGFYVKSLDQDPETSPELIVPLKVLWLHVNTHNIAILLVLENHRTVVYQFNLLFFFTYKSRYPNTNFKTIWKEFCKRTNSIEDSQIKKCIAFNATKNFVDEEKKIHLDFLIVKCIERIILFRWNSKEREYAFVQEHSTPSSRNSILAPIIRGKDAYPFVCCEVKKINDEYDELEFLGIDFNSKSNWFVSFIDQDMKLLPLLFLHQIDEETIILGFHNFASIYNKEGQNIDKTRITYFKPPESLAVVDRGLLVVHKNGLVLKNLNNEITKIIEDSSKTFRLLNGFGLIIIETTGMNNTREIVVFNRNQ